jgi:hypothetical protein
MTSPSASEWARPFSRASSAGITLSPPWSNTRRPRTHPGPAATTTHSEPRHPTNSPAAGGRDQSDRAAHSRTSAAVIGPRRSRDAGPVGDRRVGGRAGRGPRPTGPGRPRRVGCGWAWLGSGVWGGSCRPGGGRRGILRGRRGGRCPGAANPGRSRPARVSPDPPMACSPDTPPPVVPIDGPPRSLEDGHHPESDTNRPYTHWGRQRRGTRPGTGNSHERRPAPSPVGGRRPRHGRQHGLVTGGV